MYKQNRRDKILLTRRAFRAPHLQQGRHLMKTFKTLLLAAALLWLGGCSIFPISSVKPGMSREEVVSTMGQPTAAVTLRQGTRLQYSGQPGGQYAFMVDLDAAGRVASV